MKKYFLTFCTLALGMLTTLWVCAQSETTTSEKTEETPGEQLIEFVLNPPEKFDLAGMQVTYLRGTPETNYFRLKCDEDLLFNAIGDEFIINNDSIGDLKHYGMVFSRYRDEYWNLNGNQLITWTNLHLKEEKGWNQILDLEDYAIKNLKEKISLFRISRNKTPFLENKNLISYNDKDGNCVSKENLIYDNHGYLIQDKITATTPIKLISDAGELYMVGVIREYHYEIKAIPSFFPTEIHGFSINKIINDGKEILETNKYFSYFFDHLDLSPSFNKANFEIIPKKEDNIDYYWISGTNTVYEDKTSGTIQKTLSYDDVNEYLANRKKTQSKYRGIYLVLAIIISGTVIFFAIKRKERF